MFLFPLPKNIQESILLTVFICFKSMNFFPINYYISKNIKLHINQYEMLFWWWKQFCTEDDEVCQLC